MTAAAPPAVGHPLSPSYFHLFARTWRGRMSLVVFLGLCQAYAMRVVMSVTVGSIGDEFGYDNPTRGTILSAFFMGYICLQLAGGLLAGLIGGYYVLLVGVLFPSILTGITPLCAAHLPTLLAIRVSTGFFAGMTYPSLHAMIGRWAPAHERSILTTIMWSGGFFGTFTTMPLAGALAGGRLDVGDITGWRSVFYLYGAFGIAWAVLFAATVTSSPETHPYISSEEKAYILSHRTAFEEEGQGEEGGEGGGHKRKSNKTSGTEGVQAALLEGGERAGGEEASVIAKAASIPWVELLKCPAFWGCVVSQTTHNWGFYLLLTWLPQYLSQQLGFDVENAGVLSFLPYMVCFLGANVGGAVSDKLIASGWWSVISVRRGAVTLGEVVPAVALVATGFVRSVPGVLALLTIAVGFSGLSVAGIACTPLDIAPHLAGATMGVMNTVGTVSGIVAPIVVGALVAAPHNDAAHWQVVFCMAAAINMVGWAVYVVTVRSDLIPELQPGYKRPGAKGGEGRDGRKPAVV